MTWLWQASLIYGGTVNRVSIYHQAQAKASTEGLAKTSISLNTEVSLSRIKFLATPAVLFALWQDRAKKKKILTGISKIARYCCYPPAPTHCRSWWKLTLNISALPWCQVKWKVKHTQEVKFCWKILVQQRRDRRAEGLCWKVSWPFCNLSPVVRFVFLVAGGLSGSEWGVESRCENSK